MNLENLNGKALALREKCVVRNPEGINLKHLEKIRTYTKEINTRYDLIKIYQSEITRHMKDISQYVEILEKIDKYEKANLYS